MLVTADPEGSGPMSRGGAGPGSVPYRVAGAVTAHSRLVLVVALLATALLGAGIPMIGADVDLEGITGDSPEARANDYVDENFTAAGEANTTTVLVVRTGENVLTRESLLESLRLQRAIRENDSINATLVDDDPITGLENVLAIAVIGERLENRADRLERRADEVNATTERLEAGLDAVRTLQRAFERDTAGLNESDPAYRERQARLENATAAAIERATGSLDEGQRYSYRQTATTVRIYESQLVQMEREYENASERVRYKQKKRDINGSYTWATLGIREGELNAILREADRIEDRADELEDDRPPLDEQIGALRNVSRGENPNITRSEFEGVVRDTLEGDGPRGDDILGLVAASYRINTTTADARMTAITQRTGGGGGVGIGTENRTLISAQLQLRDLATGYGDRNGRTTVAAAGTDANASGTTGGADEAGDATGGEYVVFGSGLIEEEIDRSMVDTLWIVGPLALLFVVLALTVAYRDPLDIALGVAGIFVVLVWTFGFLGWTGIPFNVLMVAVPVLLIGISIDFAVHVFMRHREHRSAPGDAGRDPDTSVRGAMTVALAGVGIALFWAAATTVIGFLANVVSPLGIIRQFGIASGFGIGAALVVFTTLVPAAKTELDELLESLGFDRRMRAFGTGGGRLSRVLSAGAVAARRAPLAVLVLVLLVTAVGTYGALGVETTFQQEDFVAGSPPDWTYSLPGPMAPGQYHAADDLDVVNEHFRPADARAQVLVRGDVATPGAIDRLVAAREDAAANDVVYTLPNGEADVEGPLSVMEEVAADNDSFNETFREFDADNDTVPEFDADDDGVAERDPRVLFDALFAADAGAAGDVIHRTDEGEYAAVRLIIGVEGDASYAETTADMRAIAAGIEAGQENATAAGAAGDPGRLTAVATGQPVVNRVIEQSLFETLVRSLVVTFVAVFVFLTVGYHLAGHGATLGAVTLVPVTLSVAWILGTMYLLGIPFNVLTVMITSLTIGLGVSYSIHVSARYRLEIDRQDNAWDALSTTVTGTGGALLGSAATTTGAFGTLAFAILPVLGQFGVITGVTIVYAWIASVIVLPTLLILWTRYAGPDVSLDAPDPGGPPPVAGDGGIEED